jgi:CRISPR/Cas system-associated protein Csx1
MNFNGGKKEVKKTKAVVVEKLRKDKDVLQLLKTETTTDAAE